MTAPPARELAPYLDQLLHCCPLIRSIWLVGAAVDGADERARPYAWNLVAFADALSLHRLRRAVKLHRGDVQLRVVTDGSRLESAWGDDLPGGLLAWEWHETAPGEALYTESASADGLRRGIHGRTRRRAVCVWHGIEAAEGQRP